MKSVKAILTSLEVAMLIAVVMFCFLTDWEKCIANETAWMFKTLIVLCSINAVILQREQQNIEEDE